MKIPHLSNKQVLENIIYYPKGRDAILKNVSAFFYLFIFCFYSVSQSFEYFVGDIPKYLLYAVLK